MHLLGNFPLLLLYFPEDSQWETFLEYRTSASIALPWVSHSGNLSSWHGLILELLSQWLLWEKKINYPFHSALKLEKSAISKVQKKHYLNFQKWNGKKINFCTRKKFKTSKNAIFLTEKTGFLGVLNFFLVQKLIFCNFWNCKKCVFVFLKLHFFPI